MRLQVQESSPVGKTWKGLLVYMKLQVRALTNIYYEKILEVSQNRALGCGIGPLDIGEQWNGHEFLVSKKKKIQ